MTSRSCAYFLSLFHCRLIIIILNPNPSPSLSTHSYYNTDLSNVPSKYHEFANVFSKTKAEVLPPHCPYDLKINLEEGTQPLVGPIYSLSASEQEALKKFIEENLNMDFI